MKPNPIVVIYVHIGTNDKSSHWSLPQCGRSTTIARDMGDLPSKTLAFCHEGPAVAIVRPPPEDYPRRLDYPPDKAPLGSRD